jgi:hypothetical protein
MNRGGEEWFLAHPDEVPLDKRGKLVPLFPEDR